MRRILLTTIVLLATAMYAKAGQTLVSVSDGETLELFATSANNAAGYTLSFGTGCTLKLTGDAAGGLFELKPAIVATNGRLTVDATELTNCTGIRWFNHLTTDAGVCVKGLDYVLFGSSAAANATTIGAVNSSSSGHLKADFSFVDASGDALASPAGIVLTNMVAMVIRATCPCSVANGTWLWPAGAEWPAAHVDTFELTNYNYGVIVANSLNADAIKVCAGSELSCRPCNFTSDAAYPGIVKWGGIVGTWSRNVILDGGVLRFVSNQAFTLDGSLTGSGNVRLTGRSTMTVNGAFSVDGVVSLEDSSSSLSVGDDAYAKSIVGTATNKPLVVRGSLTVGTVSGKLRLSGAAGASVVVSNLAAGASLRIPDGMDVTVLSSEATSAFVLANDNGTGVWRVGGPSDGSAVKLQFVGEAASPSLVLNGRIDLVGVPPDLAAVTVEANAVIAGDLPNSCHVHSLGGQFTTLANNSWHSKLWLWCDASETNSIVFMKELSAAAAGTAGSDVRVWKWLDRRGGLSRYGLVNKRYTSADKSLVVDVYPLTNTVDGVFCVSMGSGNGHLNVYDFEAANPTQSVATAYAIVVYGSQLGGGSAILGNQAGAFARSGYAKTPATVSSYNFFDVKAYETYVDGASVDPTVAKPNGSWQIVSVDTEGIGVQGVGFKSNGTDSRPDDRGYSNYAEILLFSEKPTEEERLHVEEYLAAKWGVSISHSGTMPSQPTAISGKGSVTLESSVRLSGMFNGTIDLNGHDLVVPSGNIPPVAADLPQQSDLRAWFDPSFAESLVMGTDPEKPLEVDALKPRTATGLATSGFYLQSAYSENGVTNRRVHVSSASHGGAATTWLDSREVYGDTWRNSLMVRQMPYAVAPDNYASSEFKEMQFVSCFVVLDSSAGGGSPLVSWANGNGGSIRHRGLNPAASDPIWSSECASYVRSSSTRLDGVAVNGTTTGFSGGPQVLSATMDGTYATVKSFACLATGAVSQEILGEAIFYKSALGDDDRADVEAYLMAKWLGKVPAGYVDFRGVTVTGSGTVTAPDAEHLPQFGAGFTGGVAISSSSLSFTVGTGATVADNAILLSGKSLAFPSATTVNLSFASRPASGACITLAEGVIDTSATSFVLGEVSGIDSSRLHLVATGTSLSVEVEKRGIVITIK